MADDSSGGQRSSDGGFEAEVSARVQELQNAVLRVLDSLSSGCENANQLSVVLGLNRRSAWKVWRFAHEASPMAAVAFLLGHQGFEIFLRAVRKHGCGSEAEAQVREAIRLLQKSQDRHAGDRSSLQAMAMNADPQSSAGPDVRIRRQAFQAQSAILGVQSKVLYAITIWEWSEDLLRSKTLKIERSIRTK